MEDIKEKIKNESKQIKKEVSQRVLGYILAAFGLVAGLAWNEAIKGFIEYLFPLSKNTVLVKFIYAVVITIVVVIVSIYLARLFSDKEKNNENK